MHNFAKEPCKSTSTHRLTRVFSPIRVNQAAEALYAQQVDRNCEDFQTGAFMPCDDAGIPGLGGSSSPCVLYTPQEARVRLWPPVMVEGLSAFRGLGAEENGRNKAKGVMQQQKGSHAHDRDVET